MQSNSNLLMEDLQNLLVRTPFQHATMMTQAFDDLSTRRRSLEIEVGTSGWIEVVDALSSRNNVFDLIHENVDAGVETLSDRVVQRSFESLLLSHHYVQEILLVDIIRLKRNR